MRNGLAYDLHNGATGILTSKPAGPKSTKIFQNLYYIEENTKVEPMHTQPSLNLRKAVIGDPVQRSRISCDDIKSKPGLEVSQCIVRPLACTLPSIHKWQQHFPRLWFTPATPSAMSVHEGPPFFSTQHIISR